MKTKLSYMMLLAALGVAPLHAAEYAPYDELPARRRQEARTHFQRMLKQPQVEPFKFALAALYLNERVDEANAGIIKEIGDLRHSSADGLKKKLNGKTQHPHLDLAQPDETQLRPDVAGSEYIKWKSKTISRVYYLFNSKSTHFPGRLSAKAEEQMHELFFAYVRKKSGYKRLSNVWINNSSENHEMMANANAYLYLQALKDLPGYADRKLDDGFTVRQHYEAWVRYFKTYCLERARWGLFWEVYSPTYGKYFMPDVYNLYDFSQDPELKKRVGDLISLTWADWACNQLYGVTGGAKTRNYLDSYLTNARQDSYFNMSRMQLAFPDRIVNESDNQFRTHSVHNTGLQTPGVLYTTSYRLPRLVYDLMTQKDEKGRFVYRSIRPAREREHPPGFDTSIYENPENVRIMWAEDSKVIKYTWYTPHYVMGTFLLSPLMEYEAGPKQNRFCSIIFDTEENARIVPVCNHPSKPKNYRQHIYLQHENVMIVAKNTYNSEGAKVSRVYFSKGMKERLVSHQGWYLLEEGESYAAVKPAPYKGGSSEAASWIDETHLEMSDDSTPIILVGGDRETYPTLDHFKAYLDQHTLHTTAGDKLTYTFTDSRGKPAELILFKDVKKLPQINQADVELSPDYTFDSPYIYSPNGSGLATLSYRGEQMVLDFTGGRSLAAVPAGTGKKSVRFKVPVAGSYRLFLKTSEMADQRGPEVSLGGRKYQTVSKAQDASWYYTVYEKSGVKEFKLPIGNLELQLSGAGTEGLEYVLLVPASKDWKE